MSKITLVFAALLILLGLVGFFGTGAIHYTALIPTWIGLVLALGGWLSISKSEGRRKLFAHINVTVGLIALIGAIIELVRTLHKGAANLNALGSKIALVALLLIYIVLCVRSFIVARKQNKV